MQGFVYSNHWHFRIGYISTDRYLNYGVVSSKWQLRLVFRLYFFILTLPVRHFNHNIEYLWRREYPLKSFYSKDIRSIIVENWRQLKKSLWRQRLTVHNKHDVWTAINDEFLYHCYKVIEAYIFSKNTLWLTAAPIVNFASTVIHIIKRTFHGGSGDMTFIFSC